MRFTKTIIEILNILYEDYGVVSIIKIDCANNIMMWQHNGIIYVKNITDVWTELLQGKNIMEE